MFAGRSPSMVPGDVVMYTVKFRHIGEVCNGRALSQSERTVAAFWANQSRQYGEI